MDISIEEKNGKYQELVDFCLDLHSDFESSELRQEKLANIKESYRVYHQKEPKADKLWKGESKLELPLHAITVDNMEPRIAAGLIGKLPILNFEAEDMQTDSRQETKLGQPQNPNQPQPPISENDPIDVLEYVFNRELDGTVKIKQKTATIVHKCLLEGTVFAIPEYDEVYVKTRKYMYETIDSMDLNTGAPISEEVIAIDEDGNAITEDIVDKKTIGGTINFVNFEDVFVSDDAEDWEKSNVIRVVRPSYASLMRKKDSKGYMNIGSWLLGDEKDERDDEQATGEIKKTNTNFIECLECVVHYTFRNDKDEDEVNDWTEEKYVVTIVKNTGLLIRFLPLIELNFKNEHLLKRIRFFREDGKAYGYSMYEKIKAIQKGATDIYNQAINATTISIIPWFMASATAGLPKEMSLKPGVGIEVDNPNEVIFPKFNTNPRNAIVFIEMFIGFWERVGSISDIQIGRINDSSKDVTATETLNALQEGNIRNNYQAVCIKEDFISLLKTLYDLYYQHLPYDATFIYRGEIVKIPRKAMERSVTFKLVGSSDMANQALTMKRAEAMFNALRNDPMANPLELIQDYVEAYNQDAPRGKYINPAMGQIAAALPANPEIPQVIQQYLQSKAMQAEQTKQAQGAG